MQIRKIFLLAGITGMLILTGCGGAATADKDPLPAEQDEGEESADGPFYEDNFAVDSAAASVRKKRIILVIECHTDLDTFHLCISLWQFTSHKH